MASIRTWIGGLAIVAIIGVGYSIWSGFASAEARKKIDQLTTERDMLMTQRDAIQTRVEALETEKKQLQAKVDADQQLADKHLETERQLEHDLAVAKENAFTGTQPEDYKIKIAQFYPAMAKSDWEVMAITLPSGRVRNYLKVPLGMADTFMFQQTKADNLESQTKELKSVVDLQKDIIGLKDQINTLTEQKAAAYKEGYDAAYNAYLTANKDLIDLLKQPRFQVPKAGALVACSLLGVLVGAGL